jgi:hypothetical protein
MAAPSLVYEDTPSLRETGAKAGLDGPKLRNTEVADAGSWGVQSAAEYRRVVRLGVTMASDLEQ